MHSIGLLIPPPPATLQLHSAQISSCEAGRIGGVENWMVGRTSASMAKIQISFKKILRFP